MQIFDDGQSGVGNLGGPQMKFFQGRNILQLRHLGIPELGTCNVDGNDFTSVIASHGIDGIQRIDKRARLNLRKKIHHA